MRKKVKFFIYDYQNKINTHKIKLDNYYYKEKTFVKDFYIFLLKKYYKKIYKDLPNSPFMVSFSIMNIPYCSNISFDTQYLYMDEIIFNNNLVHCLIPHLPIGGTFAIYKNIKLIIHSNENIHRNSPHIHAISSSGLDVRIDLNSLKEIDKSFLTKKEYTTIRDYLEENQGWLLKCYADIVNHKKVDKFEIDIIRD